VRKSSSKRIVGMGLKARESFFARLAEANPSPKTELNYNSTFELLIAVMLSAQATDISVNIATNKLFPLANTPKGILDLGLTKLKTHIKTIGLFNTKARNIMKTCHLLVEFYDSEVPKQREALEALPGVGRKTANVVLNTAFRQIAMAVDTHIFRVSNRTGLASGSTVLEVEKALLKRVPNSYLLDAHHWLILHGRYTCTARKPKCWQCPVEDLCKFKEKNLFPSV
jgi:endonuclease-3